MARYEASSCTCKDSSTELLCIHLQPHVKDSWISHGIHRSFEADQSSRRTLSGCGQMLTRPKVTSRVSTFPTSLTRKEPQTMGGFLPHKEMTCKAQDLRHRSCVSNCRHALYRYRKPILRKCLSLDSRTFYNHRERHDYAARKSQGPA